MLLHRQRAPGLWGAACKMVMHSVAKLSRERNSDSTRNYPDRCSATSSARHEELGRCRPGSCSRSTLSIRLGRRSLTGLQQHVGIDHRTHVDRIRLGAGQSCWKAGRSPASVRIAPSPVPVLLVFGRCLRSAPGRVAPLWRSSAGHAMRALQRIRDGIVHPSLRVSGGRSDDIGARVAAIRPAGPRRSPSRTGAAQSAPRGRARAEHGCGRQRDKFGVTGSTLPPPGERWLVPGLRLLGGPLKGDVFGEEVSVESAVPVPGGAIRSGGIVVCPVCGVPGGKEGTGAGVKAEPPPRGLLVCACASTGSASRPASRIGRRGRFLIQGERSRLPEGCRMPAGVLSWGLTLPASSTAGKRVAWRSLGRAAPCRTLLVLVLAAFIGALEQPKKSQRPLDGSAREQSVDRGRLNIFEAGRMPSGLAVLVDHHRAHALVKIGMQADRASQREFARERLRQG